MVLLFVAMGCSTSTTHITKKTPFPEERGAELNIKNFRRLKAQGLNRGMKDRVIRHPKKGVARETNILYMRTHDQ
jgi:hypothetical protein